MAGSHLGVTKPMANNVRKSEINIFESSFLLVEL